MTDKQTNLMRDGEWVLRPYENSATLLRSLIIHTCSEAKTTFYWYGLLGMDSPCYGCHQYPPQNMIGLWKLHNMDYIQKGHDH